MPTFNLQILIWIETSVLDGGIQEYKFDTRCFLTTRRKRKALTLVEAVRTLDLIPWPTSSYQTWTVNTNLSYVWLPDVNTNLFYVWLPDLSIDLVINFTCLMQGYAGDMNVIYLVKTCLRNSLKTPYFQQYAGDKNECHVSKTSSGLEHWLRDEQHNNKNWVVVTLTINSLMPEMISKTILSVKL